MHGTNSSAIPHQLEHIDKLPLFGIFVSIPLDYFFSVSSSFEISSKRFFNHLVDVSISAFSSSLLKLSIPGILLFSPSSVRILFHLLRSPRSVCPQTFFLFRFCLVYLVVPCLIPLRNPPSIFSVYLFPW